PWPGADKAPEFLDAGATLFTVGIGGPEYDMKELNDAIGWRNSQR
ncbi:MAG: LLM class F420-dependent oxidoreductase, partial [Rhodococcus sp. (in: high G+C Gram-positive bacteria)]